jgi:hypothetical protein
MSYLSGLEAIVAAAKDVPEARLLPSVERILNVSHNLPSNADVLLWIICCLPHRACGPKGVALAQCGKVVANLTQPIGRSGDIQCTF